METCRKRLKNHQIMGNLLTNKATPSRALAVTGVDYVGSYARDHISKIATDLLIYIL